jgi:putative acetyltransferase
VVPGTSLDGHGVGDSIASVPRCDPHSGAVREALPNRREPSLNWAWDDAESIVRERKECALVEIVIRAQEPEDSDAVGRLLIQPGVVPGTLQVPFTPLASRREAAGTFSPELHRLVAEVDGRVVGSIGLEVNRRPRRRHAAALGMAVDQDVQSQGIGTALLVAVLGLADRWLNLHRIELEVMCANERAIRLYERHGFAIEGRLRDYSFTGGTYTDAFAMARLRPEPTT